MLKPKDVHWCGRVFLDEQTWTFFYNGVYYKAVRPFKQGWLRKREAPLFLQAMATAGFIPETVPAELEVEGFSAVYRQHTESYTVPMIYASCEALRESALLFLKFNKWLLHRGYALLDGHCNNIIFQEAMQPKWCDIGSIVPLTPQNYFIGLDEFIRYFFYPLILRHRSSDFANISRWSTRKGISHETASLLGIRVHLPSKREYVLDMLRKVIEEMKFPMKSSQWSDYYGDGDVELRIADKVQGIGGGRTRIFSRLFRAIAPATVVDIGANAGLFSRYMAEHGAEVLAVEPDESSVIKHHRVLRKHAFHHQIKLMVAGIGEPVYCGDMAVSLALTHHLFFTMHYPWKYIVDLLASYTSDVLLTEFMPHGLYGIQKPEFLPDNYRLEVFVGHLRRYFKQVEVIDYPRLPEEAPRIFLLCKEKRMTPEDDNMGPLPWDVPYMPASSLLGEKSGI